MPLPFPSSLGPCEERIQFAQALEAGRQEKIQEFPMRIHIRRHGADYQKSHGFLDVFGAWNNSLPTALPTRLMQMNNAKQPISGRTAHCPPLVATSYHSCSWSYSEKRASLERLLPLFEDERINVKSTVPLFFLALFYIKMCCLELST